jgi:hypothetical protein
MSQLSSKDLTQVLLHREEGRGSSDWAYQLVYYRAPMKNSDKKAELVL